MSSPDAIRRWKGTSTAIFREIFDDPSLPLEASTSPQDIEDWTSLSHVHLVVRMEDHFGVQFMLGEMQETLTVGAFVALVESKLAQAHA